MCPPLRFALWLFRATVGEQAKRLAGCNTSLPSSPIPPPFKVRRADVCNRGFSGYNTRWALKAAPKVLGPGALRDTCLVTIFLGANDSVAAGERQHVPLEEYVANLRSLVGTVRESTAGNDVKCNVVLIGPPPICDAQHRVFSLEKWGVEASRTNANTTVYAQRVVELGKELGVPVVDLLPAMLAESQDSGREFLSDGLHLSPRGQAFVFDRLLAVIHDSFPELVVTPDAKTGQNANSSSSSALPHLLPYHDAFQLGGDCAAVLERR